MDERERGREVRRKKEWEQRIQREAGASALRSRLLPHFRS